MGFSVRIGESLVGRWRLRNIRGATAKREGGQWLFLVVGVIKAPLARVGENLLPVSFVSCSPRLLWFSRLKKLHSSLSTTRFYISLMSRKLFALAASAAAVVLAQNSDPTVFQPMTSKHFDYNNLVGQAHFPAKRS